MKTKYQLYKLEPSGFWSFSLEGTKLAQGIYKKHFFCILKADVMWGLQKLVILLEKKRTSNFKISTCNFDIKIEVFK